MIRVDIGWPKQVLWPNGSDGNRRYKSAEKAKAKTAAFWLAKAAIQRSAQSPEQAFLARPVPVTIAVHASRAQSKPDKDNCIAVCKPYLDGIADAVGINDREFEAPLVVYREPYDKRIVIELGE